MAAFPFAALTLAPPPIDPAPQAPTASLIQSASILFILGGIVFVICILPPVRAWMIRTIDGFRDRMTDRIVVVKPTQIQEQVSDVKQSRREIDEFDLDLFT